MVCVTEKLVQLFRNTFRSFVLVVAQAFNIAFKDN